MVITHVFAHNLMVLWPRIRHNVSRTEFSKIQRLACLAKTGVIEIPQQLLWRSYWDFFLFM
jgi:hypothetical protein